MPSGGLLAETVSFRGYADDEITGYLARPNDEGPYPGVIVIHEVFGMVPWIKQVTRNIADRGFVALAIDLHHREGPGDPTDVAAIVRAGGGNPDGRTIGDVDGAVNYIGSLSMSSGKVGCIGFCSGGRQSYLVACSVPSLDAAVVCYGGRIVAGSDQLNEVQPRAPIDMTQDINCPVLCLFGAEDSSPSPDDAAKIEVELRRYDKSYKVYTYDDAGHGFFAEYRPSYRQHAAVEGWGHIFGWYDQHLR